MDDRLSKLPQVRELAEEMARERFLMEWRKYEGPVVPWDEAHKDCRTSRILNELLLLCDLSRPASRDALVRLGIERDNRCEARRGPIKLSAYPWAVHHKGVFCVSRTTEDEARAAFGGIVAVFWSALRDDPEALAAEILEVLS